MRRWIDNDAALNAAMYMQYMPDDMKQMIFTDELFARKNSGITESAEADEVNDLLNQT